MLCANLLSNLYHLLINADGNVNDKEVTSGVKMALSEGISESEFKARLDFLRTKSEAEVLRESLMKIKSLSRKHQIRYVAWMCVIANADGFMDKAEWHFIYQLYHKELNLQLDEVMKMQKELSVSFRDRSFSLPAVAAVA